MKNQHGFFSNVFRISSLVLYMLQSSLLVPGTVHAAESSPAPVATAVPEISLKDFKAAEVDPGFAKNTDDDNPLSPAIPEAPAAAAAAKTTDIRISLHDLPPNAVRTVSNPNFYYAERNQDGSTPKVYDIYNHNGLVVMTIEKETAPIRGNSSSAVTVPDISSDGKFLIMGTLVKSAYTGHKIETLYVRIYSISTGLLVPPSIKLLEKDNQTIGASEIPTEIRFSPGSTNLIRATNSQSGQVKYYDVNTHQEVPTLPANAVPMASNSNFYYAERLQSGSTPKVYDIYTKDGLKLFTVTKETAQIQGNYSYAISVPDISSDGKFLTMGKFTQSFYTGHVIQSLYLDIYDMTTKLLVPPSIKLLEKDNQTIGNSEIPTEIRFSPGSTNLIRVTNSQSGQVKYYDVNTHQEVPTLPANAVPMTSNPNFYYAERLQSGSTPKVYDIYTKDGLKLFTIDKEQTNIRGNYSYAVGVPDVSPDGKHLILGKFSQASYTGHKIQTLSVGIFNIQALRWESPSITLLQRDNTLITPAEIPASIQFVPSNPAYIQITYASVKIKYYSLATRQKVRKSVVFPNPDPKRKTQQGVNESRV